MAPPRTMMDTLRQDIEVDAAGCWLWTGPLTNSGYGFGRSGGIVHRMVYELEVGAIPPRHHLDHLCRVRRCCNPRHLEVVTPRENLLRSPRTMAAINSAKTHCHQGHPLSGANLYEHGGKRICRTCRDAAGARHKAKLKQQRAERRTARRAHVSQPSA